MCTAACLAFAVAPRRPHLRVFFPLRPSSFRGHRYGGFHDGAAASFLSSDTWADSTEGLVVDDAHGLNPVTTTGGLGTATAEICATIFSAKNFKCLNDRKVKHEMLFSVLFYRDACHRESARVQATRRCDSYFHVRCYADTVEEYALLNALLHMFVGFKRTWELKLSSVLMSGQLRSTIIGYRCVHKQRRAKARALTTVFSDESGVHVTGDTGLGVELFPLSGSVVPQKCCSRPPEGHIITGIDIFASSTDNLNITALDHSKMNIACPNCLPGIFNDFENLERASCQAGFCDAAVGLTMCRQCAVGATFTSARNCTPNEVLLSGTNMLQGAFERMTKDSSIHDEDQGGCSTGWNIFTVGAKRFHCAKVLQTEVFAVPDGWLIGRSVSKRHQLQSRCKSVPICLCSDFHVPCDCRQGSASYCQVNNVAQDHLSRSYLDIERPIHTSLNRWLAQIIPH